MRWSPDGTTFLFSCTQYMKPSSLATRYTLVGPKTTRDFSIPTSLANDYPLSGFEFSPDGKKLSYHALKGREIWEMIADAEVE